MGDMMQVAHCDLKSNNVLMYSGNDRKLVCPRSVCHSMCTFVCACMHAYVYAHCLSVFFSVSLFVFVSIIGNKG